MGRVVGGLRVKLGEVHVTSAVGCARAIAEIDGACGGSGDDDISGGGINGHGAGELQVCVAEAFRPIELSAFAEFDQENIE